MPSSSKVFFDSASLAAHIQKNKQGGMVVMHRTCEGYAGMVLCLLLFFDTRQVKYELGLEWMCLGLDPYGDTLQESYIYQFESLEMLLDYLLQTYHIKATDIARKYKAPADLPNPITHSDQKALFEEAWTRFQLDFKNGKFLDTAMKVSYNSLDIE